VRLAVDHAQPNLLWREVGYLLVPRNHGATQDTAATQSGAFPPCPRES
jgi:hypothetical protein